MDTNKYSKLSLKNKITASMVGFFVIILSLVYFIIIPTIREIKDISGAIEAQREDLEKKYIKSQKIRQLAQNLKEIKPKLELLDQIFINKNRELEFITSLENEANKNQISQKINLSAPQQVENKNFQKTNLQLLTKGGFIKQLRYLMNLENLSYYINVKLLELFPASDNEQAKADSQRVLPAHIETNQLNMLINADTFWN
ncbi:hypothetical protein KKA93_02340 [Patescibacteria group bacterium]|nr:hypothetical protein [Patescibacteria group bacterium]MBU1663645.1 hypothetical protein [Patescibacteria group bacterium]MBU1934224.1 hypothetical protein [Patescibacteria group bacterium]MBU2007937.1 hypothetical protein [Patescibacteria group bacterium]MBU2233280.1 hypothetical protein [Patescibacteria group bacterium]